MKQSKFDFRIQQWPFFLKVIFATIVSTTILGFPQKTTAAEKQSPSTHTSSKAGINNRGQGLGQRPVVFVPPPGERAPARTVGGGSRSVFGRAKLCPQDWPETDITAIPTNYWSDLSNSLVALAPSDSQDFPLTTSSHPSFFFYMPEMSVKEAVFSIQGENGDYYYNQTINIPEQPGIVKISLPADEAEALKLTESYRWFLVLKCGGELRFENPVVRGSIKRAGASPGLQRQLNQGDLLEQAILYGQNGIWHDTLTQLAASVQIESTPITQWSNLLDSVGLGAIAEASLVD